jgi:hypothetical protein
MKSLKERTATGIFWGGLNTFHNSLSSWYSGCDGRILMPDDYGLIGMISVFTLVANTLQESGFSSTLIKMQAPTKEDYASVFCSTFYQSGHLPHSFCVGSGNSWFLRSTGSGGLFPCGVPVICLQALVSFKRHSYQADCAEAAGHGNLGSILLSCVWDLHLRCSILRIGPCHTGGVTFIFPYPAALDDERLATGSFVPSAALKRMFPFSVKLLFSGVITQLAGGAYSLFLGKYYDAEQVGYYTQAI